MSSAAPASAPRRLPPAAALLAPAVTAAFYLVALATLAVLALAPICLAIVLGKLPIAMLAAATLPAAVTAIRPLLPRRATAPPGVAVARHDQPALWREVERAAAAAGSQPPDALLLALDPGAAAGDVAAPLGRGGRTLVLGLPLLRALDVAAARAVIAHELAHLDHRDAWGGWWLALVEDAIARVDARLDGLPLRYAVLWHAAPFARFVRAIGRRRELAADARATAATSPAAQRAGLEGSAASAGVWRPYWEGDVAPVLDAGHRPPIADGFGRFLTSPRIRDVIAARLRADAVDDRRPDAYATHPPLARRIAALGEPADAPPRWRGAPERSALDLVVGVDAVERAALVAESSERAVEGLHPIAWEDVVERVRLQEWEAAARELGARIQGVPLTGLSRAAARASREDAWRLAAAVTAALARAGWHIDEVPGTVLARRGDGAELRPFRLVRELRDEPAAVHTWARRCDELGIGELPLEPEPGPPAAHAAEPASGRAAVIRLHVARLRTRVAHWTLLAFLALAGVPIALMFLGFAIFEQNPEVTPAARAATAAIGLAMLGAIGWVARARTGLLRGRAELVVDATGATIRHPLLRAPLVLPRASLRAADVDAGRVRRDISGARVRFPVRGGSWAGGDPNAEVVHLWADGASPLPYLGVVADTPNVAILLERPVVAPPLRRTATHGPIPGRALAGLLLRVVDADADAARAALDAAGLVRPLTLADGEHLHAILHGAPVADEQAAAVAQVA